ncbi:MAG: hypothetical protein M3540_07095 [Actinomycetota bacterium]|nr:hypothetical protein [Actinomycetota bacterium]
MLDTMTPKTRRKQTYETTEFSAMLRRMLASYGRRVADADIEDLTEMFELRDQLDSIIAAAVAGQRETHGRSWADIGRAAGTTRQAAQMRWGKTTQDNPGQVKTTV